jgi:hypothetical protein
MIDPRDPRRLADRSQKVNKKSTARSGFRPPKTHCELAFSAIMIEGLMIMLRWQSDWHRDIGVPSTPSANFRGNRYEVFPGSLTPVPVPVPPARPLG